MPPIWLDEHGQCAQTRPCTRPGCGREAPIRRYRYETLRQIGWPLYRVARYVEWCGHGQEFVPMPDEGEWVRLVPIVGKRDSGSTRPYNITSVDDQQELGAAQAYTAA